MNLFYRMGITEKDGFVRPKVFREVPAAARKWITENAGTYRIQRFVEKKG